MTGPLVSVVVPAYNQCDYLREALQDALCQTHRELEVIVVDDGSTDGTRAVCESFQDTRIRYVHQRNDGTRGIGARNQALMLARGEWVAPLDQDDRWSPAKLERQLARAEELQAQGRAVGAVFCPVQFIDEHGVPTRRQAPEDLPEGEVFHALLARNHYFVSAGVFRRELLGVAGLPHESCGLADWALWLGVARHAQVGVVREHLAQYREHSQGYQAQLLLGNRLRFAQDQWRTVQGQAPRLHPGCAECRRIHARALRGVAQLYLRSARRTLAARQWNGVWSGLGMAWSVAPGWLARPWVFLLELIRLAGSAVQGAVSPSDR